MRRGRKKRSFPNLGRTGLVSSNVNSVDGWKSIEEIDKRSDYIFATHDETVLEHEVYPYEGMPIRQRRQTVAGTSFYFGGI